jgi:GTPase SAR1 family protein
MWDTVGKEEFRAMNSFYYNGANGAIVTFDVGNRKSFESLDYWINDIREVNNFKMFY